MNSTDRLLDLKNWDIWWEMELLILCSMVTVWSHPCMGWGSSQINSLRRLKRHAKESTYYDDNGTYISDECSHKVGKVIDALGLIDPSNILEPCNVQTSSMSHIAIGSLPVRKKMFRREWPLGILPSCGYHDRIVRYTGSETWTNSMGYKVVDGWRQWMSNDQVAGYTHGYANNLTFLKIKGAGHSVPEVKPREALDFYRRFLAGEKIKTSLIGFNSGYMLSQKAGADQLLERLQHDVRNLTSLVVEQR
ncbi:hypothetical protein F2Q69_00036072 [Brassica cretica]|uniref:Uncharacterized protein n=1 Tax=Brassica cretica TaxID=69181 RepID=A0A8S9SLR1_BRACR|nr:hypothetical protein F2Q69_00036072 [Brassica cretica]